MKYKMNNRKIFKEAFFVETVQKSEEIKFVYFYKKGDTYVFKVHNSEWKYNKVSESSLTFKIFKFLWREGVCSLTTVIKAHGGHCYYHTEELICNTAYSAIKDLVKNSILFEEKRYGRYTYVYLSPVGYALAQKIFNDKTSNIEDNRKKIKTRIKELSEQLQRQLQIL